MKFHQKFNKLAILEELQEPEEVFLEHCCLDKNTKNRRRKKICREKVEKQRSVIFSSYSDNISLRILILSGAKGHSLCNSRNSF